MSTRRSGDREALQTLASRVFGWAGPMDNLMQPYDYFIFNPTTIFEELAASS